MACACKVAKHIDDIQKNYGEAKSAIKTNIRGYVKIFIQKFIITLICLLLFPLFFTFLIVRKFITNKPISISGLLKLKKNVRS